MKKRILIIASLMLVAVGTLYALNVTSNAPNRVANGFERKFLPIEGTIVHKLEFTTTVRELAGTHGDSLFLMTGEPGKVYVTDMKLKKPTIIHLEDPKIKSIIPRFYTTVRYPDVYILGGNAVEYAIGNLKTGKTRKQKLNINGIFNNPILVGDNFIMRIIDANTFSARFAVVDQNGNIVERENDISKGSGDAGFVHSGLLKHDSATNQLVYMHYYDNGFEVFTPDLRLLNRYRTIDTIYTNPTEVTVKGKAVNYKRPPVRINTYATIQNGCLYISSRLLADNEEKKTFYTNTVLDKYSLKDGSYIGSFYLPNIGNEHLNQFYFISASEILAFADKQVVIIRLEQKNFAKPNA